MDFHNFSCTTFCVILLFFYFIVFFVMLLTYRVKVSDTKVTHFTQY